MPSGDGAKPPNLYDILDVPKDASGAMIKSAFRRLAKDLHPDHGGDPEQFRLLKLAYDVLSDPEQRRHYDQTGQTPDDKAAIAQEEQRFRGMVGDFITNLVAHGAAPEFTDILALAGEQVKQMIANIDGQIVATKALHDRLATVKARLSGPAEGNLLNEVLAERLTKVELGVEDLTTQRARWVRLRETLKEYAYDVYVESVP